LTLLDKAVEVVAASIKELGEVILEPVECLLPWVVPGVVESEAMVGRQEKTVVPMQPQAAAAALAPEGMALIADVMTEGAEMEGVVMFILELGHHPPKEDLLFAVVIVVNFQEEPIQGEEELVITILMERQAEDTKEKAPMKPSMVTQGDMAVVAAVRVVVQVPIGEGLEALVEEGEELESIELA
jgi:hypothetical protein